MIYSSFATQNSAWGCLKVAFQLLLTQTNYWMERVNYACVVEIGYLYVMLFCSNTRSNLFNQFGYGIYWWLESESEQEIWGIWSQVPCTLAAFPAWRQCEPPKPHGLNDISQEWCQVAQEMCGGTTWGRERRPVP